MWQHHSQTRSHLSNWPYTLKLVSLLMTERNDDQTPTPSPGSNPGERSEDAHTYEVAYRASTHAVNDAFQRLGIDHEEWHEVQKDTAFLRKLRMYLENSTMWIGRAVITVVVGGVAALIWAGVKFKIGK